jgi:hypothetical protein
MIRRCMTIQCTIPQKASIYLLITFLAGFMLPWYFSDNSQKYRPVPTLKTVYFLVKNKPALVDLIQSAMQHTGWFLVLFLSKFKFYLFCFFMLVEFRLALFTFTFK